MTAASLLVGAAATGALLASASLGGAAAAAPPAPVARTGQAACYRTTGFGVIGCAGSGQDGEFLSGAAWPEPRFADGGDQMIFDRLTGLVWTGDANPAGGPTSWEGALDYVRALNARAHLGRRDWRLPNVNELESLVSKHADPADWLPDQGFRNLQADYYWTSTTYASYATHAWSVGMHGGIVAGHDKADRYYVWPVRRGAPGAAPLPQTGQSACSDRTGAAIDCAGTGQDGETQAGVTWPAPRFVESADGTTADTLTGLVWSTDALAPAPAACKPGVTKTLQGALDLIRCLNANGHLGRQDWRLPNRNELATLVHRGQADSAAWLRARGFARVQPASYWSSSTFARATWNGWSVNLHDGAVTTHAKTHGINVWPVRGGR